jgi:hypothetical protein
LHNLLCKDRRAAYVTTYHSVFPLHLKSRFLIGPFMKALMPEYRPGDNVKMNMSYPQEDEYALSNMTPHAFYHAFYYPRDYRDFYEKFVRFKDISDEVIACWKNHYRTLVKKACLNTGGKMPVLKNPVNTGRIPMLQKMYPGAKFVHIVRNPVAVYCSSRKFFSAIIPTLSFQHFATDDISATVLDVYEKLMKDYLRDKALIPTEQLFELKYEDLLAQPLEMMEKLYRHLNLGPLEKHNPKLKTYLQEQKSHLPDHYQLTRKELEMIEKRWDFALKEWDYTIPENVRIVEG